jgi:chemotaxis methyl-accepting protein methylase
MAEIGNGHRPELTAAELERWGALIERRSGQVFGAGRARFLGWCLWQRMRELSLARYDDYYRLLDRDPAGAAEWDELAELVVNQESGFFRHRPSFDALAEHVVPELAAARARQGIEALTAWSAGCADGREAYSLAMALVAGLEAAGRPGWQVRVCGSDLSVQALARARSGRYPASRLRTLPDDYRERFLSPVAGDPRGSWEVAPALRSAVSFGRLNLCRAAGEGGDYPVGLQDVVFCQNVLIYFRPALRQRVVADLARRLRPGGYLFPAPGEVVGLELPGELALARFDGALAYRRAG